MEIGPVQAIVLGFPADAPFTGAIARELVRLQGRGVIRILDLLFVHKDDSGDLVALEHRDEDADLGAIVGALLGFEFEAGDEQARTDGADVADELQSRGMSLDDLQQIAASLEPGSSAAILLIEHAWARALRTAVRGAGGVPIAQGFLTPEAILLVGAELQAMVDALETIERANAEQLHADVSQNGANERTAGALSALDVLVEQGVLEPGSVHDAVIALKDAGLVDDRRADQLLRRSLESIVLQ
jgi:hypothetical protein